jgi:glucosamine 6-phosphate synthetase-like amidotransferase/phosphosugar isomerase protein
VFGMGGWLELCGIFGFALASPVRMAKVFGVLERLEVHQYPQEPKPVGGHGAGLAVLMDDGSVVCEKVGDVGGSPARRLSEIFGIDKARVLVGHVRMPSPEFMGTAKFRETAQPYVDERDPKLAVVSVHNGMVENYKEIREKLGKTHIFESEKVGLVDSEVVPHLFEEILSEKANVDDALYELFCTLKGSNAVGLLQVGEEDGFLHFVHKGKTRGLTIWANGSGEVVFCSRKEPLLEVFDDLLKSGKFSERVSIGWREDVGLKLSYPLPME